MDLGPSSQAQRQKRAPNGSEVQRVPKLRSSCDECSNSKVRCDQGRPSCQRCLYGRVHCNYSVSRRMGKPLSSAKNDQPRTTGASTSMTATASQQPRQIPNASSDHVSRSDGGHSNTTDQNPSHRTGPGIYSQDYDFTGLAFMMPDLNNVPGDPNSIQFLSASEEMMPDDPMNFINLPDDSTENVCLNKPNQPTAQDPEVPDGPPPFRNKAIPGNRRNAFQPDTSPQTQESSSSNNYDESDQQHQKNASCVQLTSVTLRSLSLPSTYCKNAATSSPFPFDTIDQAFATCRRAMTTYYTLIQCPCSHASHFELSLALIILQILGCYSAICSHSTSSSYPNSRLQTPATSISSPSNNSRNDTPFSHPLSTVRTSQTSRSSEMGDSSTTNPQKLTLDTPITFGDYKIDAEDEQRFILQLILTELRKVTRLIDSFTARYCSASGEDVRFPAPTPTLASHHRSWNRGDEYVHNALEQFLRNKVKVTRKEVSLMLRKLDGHEGAMDFED